MQGIYIDGVRPSSKKAVKLAAATDPSSVYVEATSLFGDEFDGLLSEWDGSGTIYFVGPNPYTKRSFYGSIKLTSKGVTIS